MVRRSIAVCLLYALAVIGSALSSPAGNRIVGGQLAEDAQMPYQIALFYEDKFRCGGSIIGARHVLTAAHCVLDGDKVLDAARFAVHAGSVDLNAGGRRYEVEEVIPHEQYGFFQHDIALLQMRGRFRFDEHIRPIELMNKELPVGSPVVISGYGRVADDKPSSPVLLYTTMFVVEDTVCSDIAANLICIDRPGNYGACNGDSGGPAVHAGKLVGVANFIIDRCGGDHPDGYAKVSFYLDWIRKIQQSHP